MAGRVDRSRLAIRGGLCTTTMGLATALRPTPIRGARAMTVTENGLVIGRIVPAWGQALAHPRRTAGWRRAEMGCGASDPGPRQARASTAETDGTWGRSGTDSGPSLIHSRPGELRSVPTMMCCEPCATDSGATEAHRRQSARTLWGGAGLLLTAPGRMLATASPIRCGGRAHTKRVAGRGILQRRPSAQTSYEVRR